MKKNKIIIIIGSTASGKSKIAINLANKYNAEIISADAFQVYKEINIGVNKPSIKELNEIKHHMINCFSIYDEFDVKIFQDYVYEIINKNIKEKKNIIICGGSNLYIDAVIKGYNLNKSLDRKSIHYFDDWEYNDIYQYVYEKDPTEAIKIGKNNINRITRVAQIIFDTKKAKSEQDTQMRNYIYDCCIINIINDRETIYQDIDNRVDKMIENNWAKEVQELFDKDNNIVNLQALSAIGYRQILESIINKTELDIDNIKKITRNYAKRQICGSLDSS